MDKTNVEIWDIIHEKIRLPSHWYQNLLFECTNLYSLNQSFHHYRFRSPLKHICTWNSRKMYFYLLSFSGRSQQWQQTRCEVAKRAGLLGIKRFFSSFQQKSITKCKSVWQELICLVLVCCMDLHTFPGKTNCIWFIIYCLICGSIFLSPICRPYTLV